jgi:hypothetical protein
LIKYQKTKKTYFNIKTSKKQIGQKGEQESNRQRHDVDNYQQPGLRIDPGGLRDNVYRATK